MMYLIGGPARCGKTTLARRVRRQIDGHVVTSDPFRAALKTNLEPAHFPDMFTKIFEPSRFITDPEAKTDRIYRRDAATWPFYKTYLEVAVRKSPNEDILFEGNVWPDLVHQLSPPHRAVFLVDTSIDQFERLIAIRNADGEDNWMRDRSDENLIKWAGFNAARSRRYIKYCEKHEYPYFDIATHGIESVVDLAFQTLVPT